MTPQSAKAKGRRLAQRIADRLVERLNLSPEDVRPTSAGTTGNDLTMSSHALDLFPFDVEAKNTERLDIWAALRQVEKRATTSRTDPLVVFSRNHADTYVALKFEDFIDLVDARRRWLEWR